VIRVAYVAGEPMPTRVPHLDVIAGHPDVELTAIYAAASIQRPESTATARHRMIVLRGPRVPATPLLHHDVPLTPQIWPLLSRERFDVLVIGGWALPATQLAMVWAWTHRVPYLILSESHGREPRPRWIRAVRRAVIPRLVRRAAGFLPTGTLAARHIESFGAPPAEVTTFPITVDVDAVGARVDELRARRDAIRAELGIPAEAVVVATAGRLIAFKAVDELIAAVARTDAYLLVVGTGPLEDQLRGQAAAARVPATFTGWRTGDALLETYAAGDVFALFSRRETWGAVVVEAAAAGLPLVLSDRVGAAEDLLAPGENGYLVPSGDVAEQADALARLVGDAALRERLGRRSREIARPFGYAPTADAFVEAVRRAALSGRR
jgi:glycosyltransferase involved in cell wall biosynthesis